MKTANIFFGLFITIIVVLFSFLIYTMFKLEPDVVSLDDYKNCIVVQKSNGINTFDRQIFRIKVKNKNKKIKSLFITEYDYLKYKLGDTIK